MENEGKKYYYSYKLPAIIAFGGSIILWLSYGAYKNDFVRTEGGCNTWATCIASKGPEIVPLEYQFYIWTIIGLSFLFCATLLACDRLIGRAVLRVNSEKIEIKQVLRKSKTIGKNSIEKISFQEFGNGPGKINILHVYDKFGKKYSVRISSLNEDHFYIKNYISRLYPEKIE